MTIIKKEKQTLYAGGQAKEGFLCYTDDERIIFEFGFWKALNEEIKQMQGRKYHGYDPVPAKYWSIPITQRNIFTLQYLSGKKPYARYKESPPSIVPTRSLRKHQVEALCKILHTRRLVLAYEMGTGKTLVIIEMLDHVGVEGDIFYIGPKSALRAVDYEFRKWKSVWKPKFYTYEALTKLATKFWETTKVPQILIFDESSYIKNPTSARSQAAKFAADEVRKVWGDKGVIVCMSGTPAPNKPTDWWHQCEVTQPGYLVEGDIFKLTERLAYLSRETNPDSGVEFNKLVAWKDSEEKCGSCGMLDIHPVHTDMLHADYHNFSKGENELRRLYQRMAGLVEVRMKKDCTDLPDKQYQVISIKPSQETLDTAKLIVGTASTTIEGLTLLRELSDGFQYQDVKIGERPCSNCNGTKQAIMYDAAGNQEFIPCHCGTGLEAVKQRQTIEVDSPKLAVLGDIIDNHDEIGRLVVFAGYTASIDRIQAFALKKGWHVIRVDGTGWFFNDPTGATLKDDPLVAFQDWRGEQKILFVAHPGSGGMSITLTRSPTAVFYSNDYNAAYRQQAEDRIHRIGMDVNRGATIIDLIHLPSDRKVLETLLKKQDIQSITMGQVVEELKNKPQLDAIEFGYR